METSFAKWLREQGDNNSAYALRNRMNYKRVSAIAGIARKPSVIHRFDVAMLAQMSKDSGISIDTLIAEAISAMKDPTPPRKYTYREKTNGKEAAE